MYMYMAIKLSIYLSIINCVSKRNMFVVVSGALRLLDELPETVYRVCDLIIVVTNRNGDKWRDSMLVCLVNEVRHYINIFI